MVKRNLTGAHYGLNSWIQQRVTAVIMLVLTIAFIVFIGFMATQVGSNIVSWQIVFHYIGVRFLFQIFFVALLWHAWVGMRDIWMDYVQCSIGKLFFYTFTLLWLLGSLIYSIKVIWI